MSQVQQQPRQMAQRPARRLPTARRLDYILIPAPLDLSLDTMTEKSPLPAIIVTPSSPSHEKDFAIAFLAQPKRPSLLSRCTTVIGETVKGGVGKVGEGVRKVKETMPVTSPTTWNFNWRWRRSGYAPIALPISAPATQSEFNIPTYPSSLYPGERKKTSKLMMVVMTVFVLVFCHMLAHFFARASLASPVVDFASTSPLASSTLSSAGTGSTTIDVEAPAASGARAIATNGETAVAKAYAYLGKLDMQGWLGWVVNGKKRSP